MSDTITITDIADVREGDWVVAEFEGHRFEGEAWRDSRRGGLNVGGIWLTDGVDLALHVELIEARRPKPELPTAPSLIRGTVLGAPLLMLGPDEDGDWHFLDGGSTSFRSPGSIDDFEILWTEDA